MSSSILLIEDEASIHEMLDLALTNAGFTLEHAINVTEAKNIIFNRLPELILLDWMLPGMSGIEFAKQLKKDQSTQEIPIIMLTARGEEADRRNGGTAPWRSLRDHRCLRPCSHGRDSREDSRVLRIFLPGRRSRILRA